MRPDAGHILYLGVVAGIEPRIGLAARTGRLHESLEEELRRSGRVAVVEEEGDVGHLDRLVADGEETRCILVRTVELDPHENRVVAQRFERCRRSGVGRQDERLAVDVLVGFARLAVDEHRRLAGEGLHLARERSVEEQIVVAGQMVERIGKLYARRALIRIVEGRILTQILFARSEGQKRRGRQNQRKISEEFHGI